MPPGVVGRAIGAAGSGDKGSVEVGSLKTVAGKPTELAAEESIKPPAPAAPKRNNWRRLNDIKPLRNEAKLVPSGRLISDKRNRFVAPSTPDSARLVADRPILCSLGLYFSSVAKGAPVLYA